MCCALFSFGALETISFQKHIAICHQLHQDAIDSLRKCSATFWLHNVCVYCEVLGYPTMIGPKQITTSKRRRQRVANCLEPEKTLRFSQSQLVYSFLAMQDDNQWGIGRTGARENDLITSQDNWLKCSVKVQIHEGKTFPNKSLACVPLQKLFEDKPFDIQIVYPCTACTDMHLSVYEKWYVIIRAKIWVASLHSAKLSYAARLLFLSKWSHCSLDRFVWFNPWGSAKCCNGGAG